MITVKRTRLFLILLAVCAAAAAAQQVVEEIVAIVNDEVITLSDYKKEYDLRLTQVKAQVPAAQQEKALEQIKAGLLDSMITEALLLQLAKEKNLNVSDQLKMSIENIKKENNLDSDDDLKRALQSQGLQYDSWLKQLEETILRQSVVYSEINKSIVVDDAEVIDYYKKHGAEFVVPEEYKVKAVYLAPDLRSAAETEARKAEILDKLKGGLAFDKAVEEYCDTPLKEAKGDLGTLKKGETDKILFDALAPFKKGERTGWIEGKKGWYLLSVEDKKDTRTRTFDEAKRDIEQKMFQERQAAKLDEFLKNIKKKNYIKILKPNPLG
ncbi:MAG: SurA N-terminal domain-containing protein [Candidatus Aminicenantales bacterium]|jgi:parvulin-like peptidyl-prolyl isomerase